MSELVYEKKMQIRSFRGAYSALSNFGGAPFVMTDPTNPASRVNVHADPTFNTPNLTQHPTTAEHHFQALKTLDVKQRWWIYGAQTPKMAKMAKSRGRLVDMSPVRPLGRDMRADWPSDGPEGESLGFSAYAMSEILAAKFAVPANRTVLLATEGFDLVEGNTHHDQIWGDCECSRHRDTPGQNLLGQLLMRERELILSGRR